MRKKIVRTVDLVSGDRLVNMFDYLCSKVDWGKANLDAEAVACMNTLFLELGKDTRKFIP